MINARTSKPQPAQSWENLPSSVVPPLEMNFTIGASRFYGLLIDDPSDPQKGYDTLLVNSSRDGKEVKAKLKSEPAGPGGELFGANRSMSRQMTVAMQLFISGYSSLNQTGVIFFFFTRPTHEIISRPDLVNAASSTTRAFIGNGANPLYAQGALGPTLPNGGDGTAEARYLETVSFAQHQLAETNRWALEQLPWEFFVAYTPFPDEAEHMWRASSTRAFPVFAKILPTGYVPFCNRFTDYRTNCSAS